MFLALRVEWRTAGNRAFRTLLFGISMLNTGRTAQKHFAVADFVARHRPELNPDLYEKLWPPCLVEHLINEKGKKPGRGIRTRKGKSPERPRLTPLTMFFSCCSPAAVRKCWRLLEGMMGGGSRTDGPLRGG